MRFAVTCPHCRQRFKLDYADSAVYDLTCPHCAGTLCLFVRKQKFEVLFDLGAGALLAGYAREAVSSFAAALERFFEFYVRAAALEQSAGESVALEEAEARFQATWKLVDRQSERQMGMLALAYLLREGQPPEFLKPQTLGTEFRNAVIHRGYLPRRDEVETYAGQVFALIERLLGELGDAALQVEALDELQFARHFAALPPGTPAVIEEHPGLFRARMFGRFQMVGQKLDAGPGVTGAAPANSRAPAEVFQAALQQRGQHLGWKNGAGEPLV